jgi:hypothetical protein
MTPEEKHRARHEAALKAAAAPRPAAAPEVAETQVVTGGAGTELRKMLHLVGIQPRGPACKCNEHAAEMDRQGTAWCEEHIEEIVDWLEAEAKTRPLLGAMFARAPAKQLVRMAIRRAKARGF